MINGDQWLISPYTSYSHIAFYVHSGGNVSDYDIDISGYFGVRPVVVLKSGVKMVGGNGTSGSPYKLALSE